MIFESIKSTTIQVNSLVGLKTLKRSRVFQTYDTFDTAENMMKIVMLALCTNVLAAVITALGCDFIGVIFTGMFAGNHKLMFYLQRGRKIEILVIFGKLFRFKMINFG